MKRQLILFALASLGAATAVGAHALDAQQILKICGEQISLLGDGGDTCMRAAAATTAHSYTMRIEIDGQRYAVTAEDGLMATVRAAGVGVEIIPKGVDSEGRVSLAYHVVDFADDKDVYGRGLSPDYALLPLGMTAKIESLAGRQITITMESMHD
ncbi:hypothetical protein KDX16_15675 [Burkholderia vietnamiensis]|jgi:hypothetical protein|uniref:Uncharacterized protein n=2 Tax=Burkholderia aenigmatica TaxID=2015348 RepID=A0A228HM24_9BURK|nr:MULTISPECIES: hypothetical protein [Burkholderia]HDR9761524.1 hypothetical protein [Burkholderia cepacia ATCC 25416]MBR7917263.1 hypothetical protein [Burkholderia vietnamiensis]MBR8054733.1 hypothetical protein [Burkholderia vietnamiensis]OXI30962.1 hypothetical protein CFB84_43145 [Burkholderia aenigmatica]HDR9791935.1 hypothetical protein [Burkholderia cepacia ATCC 25416]